MSAPEQLLAAAAKPLTLQEISELRKKAMQQAGNSSLTGPDWTNAVMLILAEQVAVQNNRTNFDRILGLQP